MRLLKIICVLSILWISGCSRALTTSYETNALLWKLEGPGIETSYLFGTIHIMPREQFEIGGDVSESLRECSQLVLELDLDNISIQTEVLKYAAMENEQTLSSLIAEEDYEVISKVVQETLGVGLASFDRFKPFVISTFLISRYVDGAPASFELSLTTMAEDQGIPVEGLETIEQQMAVFDRIPYEVQAKELVEMVKDEDQVRADYKKLLGQYQTRNLKGMYDTMLEYMTSKEQVEELLDKRNEKWIPQIQSFASDQPTFFAVGAAHLAGEKGLISLLQEAGYTLTPQ